MTNPDSSAPSKRLAYRFTGVVASMPRKHVGEAPVRGLNAACMAILLPVLALPTSLRSQPVPGIAQPDAITAKRFGGQNYFTDPNAQAAYLGRILYGGANGNASYSPMEWARSRNNLINTYVDGYPTSQTPYANGIFHNQVYGADANVQNFPYVGNIPTYGSSVNLFGQSQSLYGNPYAGRDDQGGVKPLVPGLIGAGLGVFIGARLGGTFGGIIGGIGGYLAGQLISAQLFNNSGFNWHSGGYNDDPRSGRGSSTNPDPYDRIDDLRFGNFDVLSVPKQIAVEGKTRTPQAPGDSVASLKKAYQEAFRRYEAVLAESGSNAEVTRSAQSGYELAYKAYIQSRMTSSP